MAEKVFSNGGRLLSEPTSNSVSSSVPVSRRGDRIVLNPLIKQPEGVFTAATYWEFLGRVGSKLEQINKLEKEQVQERIRAARELGILRQEYLRRLPFHFFAQCPYCGASVLQALDSFSLLGFHPELKSNELLADRIWHEGLPPRQRCRHTLLTMVAVNLHNLLPDDLPEWALLYRWGMGRGGGHFDSAPHLIVWPLIAQQTSAVIHALPIGRLDDPEPIHRYTAYAITYFFSDETNLYADEMWVPTDLGDAATGGVWHDTDLIKWVKAGRLYWMDPKDTSRLVQESEEEFPYANIQPQGWYEIAKGGTINGPKPYGRVWEGEAPAHDESFPKTIEYEWDELKKKRHFWRPVSATPEEIAYREAKRRAYRQAGHAVASCLIRTKGMVGVPPEDYPQLVSSFDYVTIEGQGPDWGKSQPAWRNLVSTMVVLLTGYVAERIGLFSQDRLLSWNRLLIESWSSPLIKQCLELARRRLEIPSHQDDAENTEQPSSPTERRAKEYVTSVFGLAANLCRSHSWYIDRVADALLRKKTLSQEEVFDIIEFTRATDEYLDRIDTQSNETWRWQRPDLRPNLYDLEYVEAQQKKVVTVAQDILDGRIGIIKGARLLSGLRYTVTRDEGDPDFLTFVGIGSETDHLPVGVEREFYAKDALVEKDKEIKRLEDRYQEWAFASCRALIARFADGEAIEQSIEEKLEEHFISSGDDLLGFLIDIDAYLEDTGIFRNVKVVRTGNPKRSLLATCELIPGSDKAQGVADILENVWLEELCYKHWENHVVQIHPDKVALFFITTSGDEPDALCVTGKIIVSINS